jgi:hypothetical protein
LKNGLSCQYKPYLNFSTLNKPGKVLKRPIISGFSIGREAACREFPHSKMVGNTIAANAFSAAGFIGAVAV